METKAVIFAQEVGHRLSSYLQHPHAPGPKRKLEYPLLYLQLFSAFDVQHTTRWPLGVHLFFQRGTAMVDGHKELSPLLVFQEVQAQRRVPGFKGRPDTGLGPQGPVQTMGRRPAMRFAPMCQQPLQEREQKNAFPRPMAWTVRAGWPSPSTAKTLASLGAMGK